MKLPLWKNHSKNNTKTSQTFQINVTKKYTLQKTASRCILKERKCQNSFGRLHVLVANAAKVCQTLAAYFFSFTYECKRALQI